MQFRERYGPWGIVVGGSEGLGLALATELGRRGVNLLLVARREDLLERAAESLRTGLAIEVRTLACDAGSPIFVETVVKATEGLEIGFLIYSCAAEHGGQFLDLKPGDHLNNIAVNCTAPTLLVHALGTQMVSRGRGGIVLCSSLAAMQGIYNWVSYGGAKAYEMLLGEGLWDELGVHGVDACSFMIGSTYTPNFVRNQKVKGTIFAQGRVPQDAPEDLQVPQLPEEAAANLFRQLEREWLPLNFANPLDEERHRQLRTLDRATVIRRIGDMQRSGYRSTLHEARP